ncbi:SH3 domain-containing protein [Tenacibaculum caenipelagi]|uniref:SH3 domain-containing protein n=1 Tax=Tenacibaculum caenipelagi TaxID=1325435 RepID=A0A4R6TCW0_9FLAO|nr:SH3 domain-containing protein [Tenacibaculum caenipelagi]TDQ25634.1 SH3 domain-containing protein [Tenacibaculum caenipelagi]
MKLFKIILFVFLGTAIQHVYGQEVYIEPLREFEFTTNQKVYLFGNDVKLRKEPNTGSEVISLLKIASEVTIVEKSTEKQLYNGFSHHWYKVKHKDKEGFVLGGLLALDSKKIDDSVYLVTLRKEKNDTKVLVRVVNGNDEYIENSSILKSTTFSIKVYDNKGISSIKNMIYIDYLAEACGVEGGGCYLFNNGKSLVKSIELSSISEAGLFWFKEDVVFPTDLGGQKGKIILKREGGQIIDEESNHTKVTLETKEFSWEGTQLIFNVK